MEGARLVLNFSFKTIGVERLEARVVVQNGRGNGALRKLGAVPEGLLRQSFHKPGECHDQLLYSLLASEWQRQRTTAHETIH